MAVWVFVFACAAVGEGQPVSNIRVYRIDTGRIAVWYDLAPPGAEEIGLEASSDGGAQFTIRPRSLSGDVGRGVASGGNRRILWDAERDGVALTDSTVVRITGVGPASVETGGQGSVSPEVHETPSNGVVTAVLTDSVIRLDGFLDEEAWKTAVPVSDFTQQELREGEVPTERTEVRILCDRDRLYIGVVCHDRDPGRIISRALTWDGALENDDMFAVVLDTYRDRRAGFWFAVNPNGARADATFRSGDKNNRNAQWDGIWETSARIGPEGWTCEIAIPFKTLRFPATGTQEWGLNFHRVIRRKNEEVLWRGWRRNEGIYQLTAAGTLVIPERVKSGVQLDVTPYALGGSQKSRGIGRDDMFKYGLDLRYGITSNTLLDLTTKTDFAQVESDRDVINLSRFSITYPEKRDFFLEGMENFEFTQYTTMLFYSRKIGIDPDTREAIPIRAGAKLTRKSGGYRLGVLSVQTDSQRDFPETNYSVLRLRKDIFKQSTIGFIGTNVVNRDRHDSQLYGVDFSLKTDRFMGRSNFLVDGYAAQAVNDGKTRDGFSGRFNVAWPNDLVESFLLYNTIGKDFDPEIGYIQRTGIQTYIVHVQLHPRPPIPGVKKLTIQPFDFNDTVALDGRQLTRIYESRPLGIVFNSGNELTFTIDDFLEYVDRDFTLFGTATVPRGTYNYTYYTIRYATSKNRALSASASSRWGGFYDGDRDQVDVDLTLKSSSHLSLTADMTWNDITAGAKRFTTREYGGRVQYDVSTRLSSSLFAQYNNRTRQVNVNARIHFIPRTGSDLYLVYNRLLDESDRYAALSSAGMFKLNWTYRL